MKLRTAVCFFWFALLVLSGCGGGGGGGDDSNDGGSQPSQLTKQEATDTVMEFSTRVELLKMQFLALASGNFTQEMMTSDPETFSPYYDDGTPVTVYDEEGNACTIENTDCDAEQIYTETYARLYAEFMDNRDAILAMQDDTEASFGKLGIEGSTPVAAGVVRAQGVGDWLYEKTWFGNSDRKMLGDIMMYAVQNDENGTSTSPIWEELQDKGYTKGAENLDEWLEKLDKGEMDYVAEDVYDDLMSVTDDTGMPIIGEAASMTGHKRSDVVVRNGAKLLKTTYEIGKITAEVALPGGKIVIKTFDTINKFQGYYQKIKEGKIKEVAQEIIIQKVTDKFMKVGEGRLSASKFGKSINHAIKTTKDKYDKLKTINDALKGADSSGASGVTVSDKAPSENPDQTDGLKRAALVITRPTAQTLAYQESALLQSSYEVLNYMNEEGEEVTTDIPDDSEDGFVPDLPEAIVGLLPDSDFFDFDLGLEDFTFPLAPGDYEMTVADSDGHVATNPGVSVEENTISPALIETSEETDVNGFLPPSGDDLQLTVYTKEWADGDWDIEVIVPYAYAPDYAMTVWTDGSGLLSYGSQIVNNDLQFTESADGFTFTYTPNPDTGAEHVLTIQLEDALGLTTTVNETLVLDESEVPGTSATFAGTGEFADDDSNFWTVEVVITFDDTGNLIGEIGGDVYIGMANNNFPLTGGFTGTWTNGSFSASGNVNVLNDGEVQETIPFNYNGTITDLDAETITGTLSDPISGSVLKTFSANRVND